MNNEDKNEQKDKKQL